MIWWVVMTVLLAAVDAGLGAPSQAAEALEMGADAVLLIAAALSDAELWRYFPSEISGQLRKTIFWDSPWQIPSSQSSTM